MKTETCDVEMESGPGRGAGFAKGTTTQTFQTFTGALNEFKAQVTTALNGKAEDKGYSAGGDSGGRPMLDAVALVVGEGTHPAGEILYKLARYRAKRNPEDLVKVAAWAFLMWDQHMRKVTSEVTNR